MSGGKSFQLVTFAGVLVSSLNRDKSSFSADFRARLVASLAFSARGWSTLARKADARLLPG